MAVMLNDIISFAFVASSLLQLNVHYGKAPIHCLTQSCYLISCYEKPVKRTYEISLEIISSVRTTGFQ